MFEFCLPTSATSVPNHPVWLHEVKYDGYRMMVIRDGDRVRLISRGGIDYATRSPWIVEAARRRPQRRFIIDGEAVLLASQGGISDFDGLHSGKYNDVVMLYAFDILLLDGDDLRKLPLALRKRHLERLLKLRPDGIFVAPFEQGELGPDLFRAACRWGLEGLVSKRADRPLRRTVEGLAQGQEPRPSGLSAGAGSVLEACTHQATSPFDLTSA